jgi:type IV secretory pathway component VirB8
MLTTYQLDTFTIIAVIALASLVVLISLNAYIRSQKKKPFDRKMIDPSFILNLKNALGFDNLLQVLVEHERVKFKVSNIKQVNFDLLKTLSNTGVFVKGKDITMTFDYEPRQIKKQLEKGA